jgi:tetratricopeptide (TPR) repeat protein
LPLLAAVVLAGSGAYAQALHPDCPDDPGDEEQTKAVAGEWFAKGEALVKQAQYDQALGAFMCAYALVPHPAPVFNAAQAARSGGDHETALKLLRQYLMIAPVGPLSDLARQQIAEYDAKGLGGAPPPPPPVAPGTPVELPPEEEEKPWDQPEPEPTEEEGGVGTVGTVGWVFFGVGLATAAAGGVLQGLAGKAVSDGEATDDYAFFADQKDKVDAFQKGAIACFIAGGALLTTGIVMVVVDKGGGEEPAAEISLAPTPGGLVLQGAF